MRWGRHNGVTKVCDTQHAKNYLTPPGPRGASGDLQKALLVFVENLKYLLEASRRHSVSHKAFGLCTWEAILPAPL